MCHGIVKLLAFFIIVFHFFLGRRLDIVHAVVATFSFIQLDMIGTEFRVLVALSFSIIILLLKFLLHLLLLLLLELPLNLSFKPSLLLFIKAIVLKNTNIVN